MNKKIIPGFGRYNLFENGSVERRATSAIMDATNGIVHLVDDNGKNKPYNTIEGLKQLFPESKKNHSYKKREKFILPDNPEELLKLKRPHKITPEQVIEMRAAYTAGTFKPKHGPVRYGICAQTAGKIIHRVLYPNI